MEANRAGSGCGLHSHLPRSTYHQDVCLLGVKFDLLVGVKDLNPFLLITHRKHKRLLLLSIQLHLYESADAYPLSYANITNTDF